MAAGLLDDRLRARGVVATVASAGTLGWSGRPATATATVVMAELGVDISAHNSRRLDHDLVRRADLVLAMTRQHAWAVEAWASEARHRTFLVPEFVRLARATAPSRANDMRSWIGEIDSARPPSFPVGRAVDEIDDPAGHEIEVYRATRDRLRTVLDPLAEMLTAVV